MIDFSLLEIGSRKINKQLCYDNVLLHVIRHESIDFVSSTSVGSYCDVPFYIWTKIFTKKFTEKLKVNILLKF